MPEPSPPEKTVVLTKLLFEQSPLCAGCISTKSGLAITDIERTARRCEETIRVTREIVHCKACKRWTLVYSLFGVQRRT
jgi:hypothetical protein